MYNTRGRQNMDPPNASWRSGFMDKVKGGVQAVTDFLTSKDVQDEVKRVEVKDGMNIMKVPVKISYEDHRNRVRRCIIGKDNIKAEQRTIMMVGATGAGKSTLIDGICNYIFDVQWEATERLTLIDMHPDEQQNKAKGQSTSQTDWITVYSVTCGKSDRVPYTLNLIDTPGFGDSRGLKRDEQLVEQLRALFQNPRGSGIDALDAVCFLAKAPDARLTHTQKYIFDSILAIFGNNIKDNIIVMITFADAQKSPVLAAIKEANLPHRKTFKFNNSALFANNGNTGAVNHDPDDEAITAFSKLFWDMGIKSFEAFFRFLTELNSKSLTLTKEVLDQRRSLKDTLHYLEAKVQLGISHMSSLKKEEQLLEDNQDVIEKNKNFTYTLTEDHAKEVDCEANRHVTHCMHCHNTCHDWCGIPENADKSGCWAMGSNGYCERCPQHCHWTKHRNTGKYIITETVTVTKTYEDRKEQYAKATGKAKEQINVIDEMKAEYEKIQREVEEDINKCRRILQRLSEIALKPDPLSEVEYIEMLIQAERSEGKADYEKRVAELQIIKNKAQRLKDLVAGNPLLKKA